MTTIQISANVQTLLSDCQSASEFNSIMVENYPNFFKEGTHTATIVSMLSKQFAKTFANYTEASYYLENLTIDSSEAKSEDVKETETTKSEATNDANKATNEDASEQTSDEKQAFLKRCEVVKGLLQTEKNADLVKAIALKHSPKYATNQKSTVGSKIKELFIELTQLGFSKPQIFDLKIIGIKGTALSPASVSDTYKIATGERVRSNEPKNTGEAKLQKPKTAKSEIERIENAIKARYTKLVNELTTFESDMSKLIDEHKEAKQTILATIEANEKAKQDAARVLAIQNLRIAFPQFASMTDEQIATMFASMLGV